MKAIGIFGPLLAVNLTLGTISKTLASVVTWAIVIAPVVWSLNELRRAGREALAPAGR